MDRGFEIDHSAPVLRHLLSHSRLSALTSMGAAHRRLGRPSRQTEHVQQRQPVVHESSKRSTQASETRYFTCTSSRRDLTGSRRCAVERQVAFHPKRRF